MAQFTLNWDNTAVLASSNATGQRALYLQRSVGLPFISVGFNPTNDLAKTVTTTDSPNLSSNVVYQFKIQTLCTANGPTDNDNGIQEIINFIAITPNVGTHTDTTATIIVDTSGTDITKVRFTLRKASDNSLIFGPTIVNVASDEATLVATGLVASTNYYWQMEFYATVNNVDVISSSPVYYGSIFSPYPFATDAPPVCNPVTSITVSSIEIP